MRIAIIGAGALGSLFGGVLTRGGHDVWLYNPSNKKHIHAIQKNGLRIQTGDGDFEVKPNATTRLAEIPLPIEVMGIFVKAYDTERAISDALPLISTETWTLSLQNGIGPEVVLAQHVLNGRLLRGVTAQGATLIEAGIVRWGGRGPTQLGLFGTKSGQLDDSLENLCATLSSADWKTHFTPEIEKDLWVKLLVNAAINPLTALFNVPNGQLIADKELNAILHGIIREALPVTRTHGVQLSLEEAISHVEGVCRGTAQNLSSMLQDVRRGKRTEIEYINGVVAREAKALDAQTPLNSLLTRLVMRSPY
ncbi:2-dehydropantoate 2-reductase [Candidatus Acetothermia bacterium]|nr:2-dehydropantoate 2-reductase [Candidatus Acetothermia bacterium]MBI3643063.1 2-dehydropantoate 2-reductase [Candidatus Acetothermia bacterium]